MHSKAGNEVLQEGSPRFEHLLQELPALYLQPNLSSTGSGPGQA